MESSVCLFALLSLAFISIAEGQTPPQVVQPGKSVKGVLSSGSTVIFEIPVQAPFPTDTLWVEIIATRPTVSDQCHGEFIAMATSTTLADIKSQNSAHIAFSYRNCFQKTAGQIERYLIPSNPSPMKIYAAVTAATQGSYQFNVSYRGKEVGKKLGMLAPKQSNPWHIMIRRSSNTNSMEPFCSGSLISPRWVLTAAPCLKDIELQEKAGREFDVRLGAYSTQGDDLQVISFKAADVYALNAKEGDLGLLRMSYPVSVSDAVAPISLPSVDDPDWIQPGLDVTATHWNLDLHAAYSVDLHQLNSSILLASKCELLAQSLGLSEKDPATGSTHLCAAAASSQSSCSGNGDLGSPLVGMRKGAPVLIGVLSSGQACRTKENIAVYSNVLSYAQSIDDAVNTESISAFWYPQGKHLPFKYSNGGTLTKGPFRGVLMTLETYSYTPSTVTYYGWRNPPHFTVQNTPSTVEIYQHFPINVAARALTQGETATANTIEIALAWKSTEIDKLPVTVKEKLAELMRWIEGETGIKRTSRQFYKPLDAYGEKSPQRMSELEWKYFNGWCGRQHVPGVANPDPGMIDTKVLMSHSEPVYKYNFEVYTADESGRAPNSIEVSLAGQYGNANSQLITARTLTSGSYNAGSVGQFSVSTNQNLGTLNRVRITTSGLAYSWLLEKIKVTTSDLKFTFPCKQWFDPTKGDKKTSRVFSLDGAVATDQTKASGAVQEVADGHADCSLTSVRGLANQIFHQFHCENADALTDISAYSRLCMDSTVIPYLQSDAAKSLKRFLEDTIHQNALTLTSAIRSLPEQYVLTQWRKRGACYQMDADDLSGGAENVEGLVMQIRQYDQFSINASKYGFLWAGNTSENRFTFIGSRSSALNIQKSMIESFQKLWNLNNPSKSILVSGQWDNATVARLAESPQKGFPVSPSCSYSKPTIPCCRKGNERGRCTTRETCLDNSRCASLSANEASLCSDDVLLICCSLTQLRKPASKYFHEVIIYTGTQPNSISNVDISIKLRGNTGDSENIVLSASKGYSVSPGSILRYNFSLSFDLGDVTQFDIGHSDNAFGGGFFLERVTVISTSLNKNKQFNFFCNCWLDSSIGYIETTLKEQDTSKASNCSDVAASSTGSVRAAVENNPGCSLSEAYGLAQQIIDQVQCTNALLLSDISSNPNFCIQNKAFPYLTTATHLSLQRNVNTTREPFTVLQGIHPFVYQFIQQKWSEKKMCGFNTFQKVSDGPFDSGNTVAVTETDTLFKLLPKPTWKVSPTRTYLRFTENSSDIVTAQVRAFQQLWNANNPKSSITVDGILDQDTTAALLKSPANGFASGSQCRLPVKTGTPCCTADKRKGQCVAAASCKPENERQGYCSNLNTICCIGRSSVEIEFPTGLRLAETLPPIRKAADFSDPLRRGVPLVNGIGNEGSLVSTNFRLGDFLDSTSSYLRLSPLLVECIQRTQDNSQTAINVTTGFMTSKTAQERNESSIYTTGLAAKIRLKDNSPSLLLAEIVLSGCLGWLRSQGSDLGIALINQYDVHVELRNSFHAWTLPAASITTASFLTWAQNKITEREKTIHPTPACTKESQLAIGDTYPAAMSAAAACGKIDKIIKRFSADFENLVQYPESQIAFSSEEKDNAWCGWPGRKCVDCRTKAEGFSDELKCADRMMSSRLINRLAVFQQIVAKALPGHMIIVNDAWDESTSTSTYDWGSFDANSLHYEGRAADITISKNLTLAPNHPHPPPNNNNLLPRLSALAVCAGFDHVWYKDKQSIQVSVKKAQGAGSVVSFLYSDFLCVSPPASESNIYALEKSPYLVGDGCLFDSDGRESEMMTRKRPLQDFLTSKASRYFRLHHLIPATLDLIEERLWADFKVTASIVKAYETTGERLHSLGQGIEIKPDVGVTSLLDLASVSIETAGHYLVSTGFGFGMELGERSLYYDIRPRDIDLWSTSSNMSQIQWKSFVDLGLSQASRRILPTNSKKNCYDVPSAPSSTFTWQQSLSPLQNTAGTYSCKEEDESAQHCDSTKKYRQKQVEVLWKELQNGRHFIRPKDDVKNALEMCFSELCGKCYEGDVWEKKHKHCSNFLHWAPLDYGSKENAAIFAAENLNAKEFACNDFTCLENTEIYSVLAPSIFSLYPVQEGKSTKAEIYSSGSNPLPVMEILQETFAMHLRGKVTVVAEEAKELSSIKNSLKALMAYNMNVSEVAILTYESEVDAAFAFIESSMTEWSLSVCSSQSRKYFSDVKIQTLDKGKK